VTDTTRLRRIEDRQAIRDLLVRYCYAIASKDLESVLTLFIADSRVEILGHEYRGESGLRRLYEASLAVGPKPFLHNHILEALEDDYARGRTVFEIHPSEGESAPSAGCYVDEFRKVDGDWKFETRTFRTY
jgi:uncharacterized protein (TIGR02246 family)